MIYAITVQDKSVVKIGYTKDIDSRMKQLQTGSVQKLELLFTIPGNLLQEKRLHWHLQKALGNAFTVNAMNEWYNYRNPLIMLAIHYLRQSCGKAKIFLAEFIQESMAGKAERSLEKQLRCMGYSLKDSKVAISIYKNSFRGSNTYGEYASKGGFI